MLQKTIIKQSIYILILRVSLLLLPFSMLTFVGLGGGLDKWGIVFALAFGIGAILMITWFNSKTISIDDRRITFKMLFKRERSVSISNISEVERRFRWIPAGKTLGADSTLQFTVKNEEPLTIPIEDLDEKDVQHILRTVISHNPGIKLNKLAQKTAEQEVSQYELLRSNWGSLVVALAIVLFVTVMLSLVGQLF